MILTRLINEDGSKMHLVIMKFYMLINCLSGLMFLNYIINI